MSSPLDRLKNTQVATLPAGKALPVATPVTPHVASPLAAFAKTTQNCPAEIQNQFRMPVTADQLDQLGVAEARNIGATTDRITAKFSTASFGALGDILHQVQTQANNLDVSDFTKSGIFGAIRRKTTDLKAMLQKRLQTAESAFDALSTKMTESASMLLEWERDLDDLYKENYQNYIGQRALLDKAVEIERQMQFAIDNFPLITVEDPDAFIKMQLVEEAKAMLNDAQIKADTFRRKIIICENHGPVIKNKIRASGQQRQTLARMVNEVIPLIKYEFAMFKQNLEMQKSIQLVDSSRALADTTLKVSADSSRDAALAAARSANTPIISTDTLNHIRARMLETVTGVQQIQSDAEKQRKLDEEHMKQSQAEHLAQLQQHKAV
jgi:uncharacterized protein YaaN involved in tellurite resistance